MSNERFRALVECIRATEKYLDDHQRIFEALMPLLKTVKAEIEALQEEVRQLRQARPPGPPVGTVGVWPNKRP